MTGQRYYWGFYFYYWFGPGLPVGLEVETLE